MSDIPVKSVKKALDLLSILLFEDIDRIGIDLTTLSKRLGAPLNTTHNLLKTMVACGFIAQTDKSHYIAGPKCEQIGKINELKDDRNSKMINAQMRKLSDDVQENVVFSIIAGGRRIVSTHCEYEKQLIKIDRAQFDQNSSIYRLPTGRVLTAYATESELKEIKEFYGDPLSLWPSMKMDCERIREEGAYQLTPDKPNINSYAVPILAPKGKSLGALGCYAPVFRCTKAKELLIKNNLKKTANTISLILT